MQCEFQRVRVTGVPLARCQTSKNATWGQITCCDLVTWHLGSSGHRFFFNVSNCWLNSYGKFGRSRFFAICEKPYEGVKSPPVGARARTCHALNRCQKSFFLCDSNIAAPKIMAMKVFTNTRMCSYQNLGDHCEFLGYQCWHYISVSANRNQRMTIIQRNSFLHQRIVQMEDYFSMIIVVRRHNKQDS